MRGSDFFGKTTGTDETGVVCKCGFASDASFIGSPSGPDPDDPHPYPPVNHLNPVSSFSSSPHSHPKFKIQNHQSSVAPVHHV
jgi:hypothetical protein